MPVAVLLLLGVAVARVDDYVELGAVLLVLRHLGEVQGFELGELCDHIRPVVGVVLQRVAVQGQTVQVGQLLQDVQVCELTDLVAVQVDHLERRELQDVLGDDGDVVEAEVQPGDVLGILDHVQGHLVETLGVHQVVVGQPDDVGVVAT